MATESGGSIKPVAVIILGADALLAARPATPIQLWHACLAAGYHLAVPATWGDELVAAECLRAVGAHPETVTVMCSCPMVARAVGDGDADLSAHLVSLVAPPVATARYLRRVYGDRRVHITYVGACPAAGDSAIDAWLTPPELLGRFAANEIDLARQPQLFESVLPPDRRRHLSQPGGMPTPERAAALPRPRQVVEIDDADVMASIRRHLMGGVRTLVDVAPRLGCACSGAMPGLSPAEARLAVTMLEPPRSTRPVIPDPGGLALLRRVPPRHLPGADARKSEERATPARGAQDDALRDRGRTVATSRPASRSPLSWNLRERALPQPPTTGRPSDPLRHRGASSAAWSALEVTLPAGGSEESSQPTTMTSSSAGAVDVDAATAAAVRALEAAAKGSANAVTRDEPASAPEESSRGESESVPQTSRPTPPGGYWFVSAPVAGASDSEFERDPPSVEDAASHLESRVVPTGEGDAVVATGVTEAESVAPPDDVVATVVAEAESVAPPEEGVPVDPRAHPDREGEPPDRSWVVAMTIILLIAGAMLARSIAPRRTIEPSIAARPLAGRVEIVSGDSLQIAPEVVSDSSLPIATSGHGDLPASGGYPGAIADVVAVAPAGQSWRRAASVNSLFVAPRVSPVRAPSLRPPLPPRIR